MSRTAAVVIIGNEILSGKVRDLNSPWLARELRRLGTELRASLVVPDELDAIAEAVRLLAPRVTGLITSGGVGPTHDDVTMAGVARAFGVGLSRNARLEALVRSLYDPQARETSLRMADLPEGAELIEAAGLRAPVVLVRNVYVLPGVPSLFRRKFRALRDRFRDSPFQLRQVFLGCGEAELAERLYALAEAHPDVQIGSYPRFDSAAYAVRVTFETKRGTSLDAVVAELIDGLPSEWVRSLDEPPDA